MQFALLLKYFKVHTLESITRFDVWVWLTQISVQPTANVRNVLGFRERCRPPEGVTVFWIPRLSLQVTIIVSVREATVRDRINWFALFFPALCPHPCRLLILRKGQVGRDAVPDSVAQHVVTAALCADQLPSVRWGDGKINENRAFFLIYYSNYSDNYLNISHSSLRICCCSLYLNCSNFGTVR